MGKLADVAQSIAGREEEMRHDIQGALCFFVTQFDKMLRNNITFEEPDSRTTTLISRLATFCGMARTPVRRQKGSNIIVANEDQEGPGRLVKQFTQLGWGLALTYRKDRIDTDVYEVLKKVGQDLLNPKRLELIKHFWSIRLAEGSASGSLKEMQWKTHGEIAKDINRSRSTVKYYCDELHAIKVLDQLFNASKNKSAEHWQLSDMAIDLIRGSEIFDEI